MQKNTTRAWIVTAGLFLLNASMFMIPNTGFSLLMTSVAGSMEIDQARVALYFSFFGIALILGSAILMKVIGKLGYRTTMLICALLGVADMFILTLATQVWQLCLCGFLGGMCVVSALTTVPIVARNWFANGGSTATGIATAGSAVAGSILSLVVTRFIASGNWHMAAYINAGWLIVAAAVALLFLVRFTPEEIGMEPVPDTNAVAAPAAAAGAELPGITFEEVRKSGCYILLGIIGFCINFMSIINVQTAAMVANSGFDQVVVGQVVAMQMICIAVGKILLGIIRDKTHSAVKTSFICLACYILGALLFIAGFSSGNPTMLYAANIPIGLGMGCVNILIPADVLEVTGPKGFASTFGPVMAIASFSALVSALVFGALYEATGGYTIPLVMLICIAVLVAILTVVTVNIANKYKSANAAKAEATA